MTVSLRGFAEESFHFASRYPASYLLRNVMQPGRQALCDMANENSAREICKCIYS